MDPIISSKDLSFNHYISYPDVNISAGSVTFIQGVSGSGKSSLLKLFNGVMSPLKGLVFYHGQDIGAIDPIMLRREVLLAGQDIFLFDGNIRDNFHQFYEYRGQELPTDKEIKQCLNICLADFALNVDCGRLSGGEKQRVFLAIHLSFRPRVLLLDEPTSALDHIMAGQALKNIIENIHAQNSTVVVVSHDAGLLPLADEIINIDRNA